MARPLIALLLPTIPCGNRRILVITQTLHGAPLRWSRRPERSSKTCGGCGSEEKHEAGFDFRIPVGCGRSRESADLGFMRMADAMEPVLNQALAVDKE